jgi:DNA-binding response OmpR family regulator
VVDDDPVEREALAQTISRSVPCRQAERRGRSTHETARYAIAAMVTDLMMPRMDGFELLRNLAEGGQALLRSS